MRNLNNYVIIILIAVNHDISVVGTRRDDYEATHYCLDIKKSMCTDNPNQKITFTFRTKTWKQMY